MSKTETLSVDLLRIDAGTQARIAIHQDTVDDYAELITGNNGAWPFGPVDVFHDGTDYFLADGFHRTLAAARTKRASIPCRVHKGTARDAKIFGMTANDQHGLRMSRADKRACVEWLLDNGPKMTQAEIAEKAGVSVPTVKRIVSDRKPARGSMIPFASETLGKSSEPEPDEPNDPEIPDSSGTETGNSDEVPFDDVPETTPAAKKKADAEAARLKKKADAAAAKEKAKADKKAAAEKAREDAKAEKLAALPSDEQARLIKSLIQQHIDKAARLAYDMNRVKKNIAKRDVVVKLLQDAGLNLW